MYTKFQLIAALVLLSFLSCESDQHTVTNKSVVTDQTKRRYYDEDSDYHDVSDSNFSYNHFIRAVQGNWKQLVGKNGTLNINGHFFHLEDAILAPKHNGNFFLTNGTGSFSNGNVFDYVVSTPKQKTHLQFILENDTILRIGIFITKNDTKLAPKIVVYKKVP